ncbi:MAG: efflux RND transporter periplasmic adaptor subunit [bacterium]|nr:efflux RND transporter periplasmic adaptor subunit [bacterium]
MNTLKRYTGHFLGLLILLTGCSRETEQRTVDLTVPVSVAPVEEGSIESHVSATGTLRPVREAQVITDIRGDLDFVSTNGLGRLVEGSKVKKGQVVARLKNREFVVGVRLEPKKLARKTAQKVLRDQETLFSRGLNSETEVDNARKTFVDADANYQDALIQIEKVRIRAPIDGFVTGLTDITEGTLVNANTVLASIMDYSEVLVDLKIPNSQIASVQIGQTVRVFNYALPDNNFEGQISEIDPALDPITRTFQVVARVANPDLLLRPGMFIKAEIVTQARNNVVLIDRKLVLRRRNQKVVFIEEEGRAQMREVETGLEDKDRVEIVSGLDPGERLITSNYETLRPRTRVRVTEVSESGRGGGRGGR